MATLGDITQMATATVTPSEVDAAFAGPAVLSNKVLVTFTPVMARLSFVEVPPGGSAPLYRAAVCMAISDLVELRNLLNRLLTDESIASLPTEAKADGQR